MSAQYKYYKMGAALVDIQKYKDLIRANIIDEQARRAFDDLMRTYDLDRNSLESALLLIRKASSELGVEYRGDHAVYDLLPRIIDRAKRNSSISF